MLKQHPIIILLIVMISSALMQADDDIDDLYEANMKCMETNNVTPEDYFKMLAAKPEALPENVLCAMKCAMEVIKVIDEDGNINPNNIDNCPYMSQLPDEQKSQLKECLGQIDKIETCEDALKTLPCANAVDVAWSH